MGFGRIWRFSYVYMECSEYIRGRFRNGILKWKLLVVEFEMNVNLMIGRGS